MKRPALTAVLLIAATAAGAQTRLEIDLWLDGGRWVGLESRARGGRRLRYKLL